MRKFILLIFIFVSFRLCAQTNVYHPFPDSNTHWSESTWWVYWGPPPCTVNDAYILFFSGDTVIGANTYHKILKSGYISASCPPPGYYYYNQYAGAIRQDTFQKMVYYLPNTSTTEQLLYDFNLNIGDTLSPSYNNVIGVYVSAIDSVLVGNNYHKRFIIKPLSGGWPPPDTSSALIEGLGSTFGLFNPWDHPVESGGVLNCFGHNAEYYPTNSNCAFATGVNETTTRKLEIEISPNPSSGVFTINATEKFQYSVYDIFGRQVFQESKPIQSTTLDLTSYPKGIYFVRAKSGKKIISRKIILQ